MAPGGRMGAGETGGSAAITVRAADGGALLPVRAQPGARRAGVAGVWNGHLRLAVRVPPDRGRANQALLELTAKLFGLRPSAVELVRGHSARTKLLRLELVYRGP